MPHRTHQRRLSEVTSAARPGGGVHHFPDPGGETEMHPEGMPLPTRKKPESELTQALRRAAHHVAYGPAGAAAHQARQDASRERAAQRRSDAEQRRQDRYVTRRAALEGEQRKIDQKAAESEITFGRAIYRDAVKAGQPDAWKMLHPEDPVRKQMSLRDRLAGEEGPGIGTTYRGPETQGAAKGEDWYIGPKGEWVRAFKPTTPRTTGPSDFTIDEKAHGSGMKLMDYHERIQELTTAMPTDEELAFYQQRVQEFEQSIAAGKAPDDSDFRLLGYFRMQLALPGQLEMIQRRASNERERGAEIERAKGQGGTGLQHYDEDDETDEPQAVREPDGGQGEPPPPFQNEDAEKYWYRLLEAGFSEESANSHVSDAIRSGLIEMPGEQ